MTTYKEAGVDIEAANQIVDTIKDIARSTYNPNILSGVGGFAAAFKIPEGYKNPIIITCTDGVGTKTKLAHRWWYPRQLGIDLVAMSVNDLITLGAKPLAFLDYYATNALYPRLTEAVIRGIVEGCEQSECALIGGEIAEMPGTYTNDGFELAGFCVGVVEVDEMISGTDIEPGDVLIGLPSSGPHSNGYSLINKILDEREYKPSEQQWLKDSLLAPTRIYHKRIKHLLESFPNNVIKGMAHITGGGIKENVERMSQKVGIRFHLYEKLILDKMPSIFNWIQERGQVSNEEMLKTFNCGTGFVVCVDGVHADAVMGYFNSWKEGPVKIGYVSDRC